MIFQTGSDRDQESTLKESPLSHPLLRIVELLEDDVLIIDGDDRPLFQSSGIPALNIIRNDRLYGDELLAIIRAVRRTDRSHQGVIEIPRGLIGEGKRKSKLQSPP